MFWRNIFNPEDLSENTSEMNSTDHTPILIYLINNLEYGTTDDFVDLQEIKEKYSGEASSICIGNFVSKFFKKVTIKNGRCKDNWTKMT